MKYTIYKNEIYTYETSITIIYCDKARMIQLKNLRFSGLKRFNKIIIFLVNTMKFVYKFDTL